MTAELEENSSNPLRILFKGEKKFFLDVLGLHCCTWAFSSYTEWGLLFIVVGASHCYGCSHRGVQALGPRASAVAARWLSSCGTWAYLLYGMSTLPGSRTDTICFANL